MKAKTIKQVLRKKLDSWVSTITDAETARVVRNNTIITGGCIASMLLQEPINDFDIYFKTKEAALVVAKYYVNKYHPTDVEIKDEEGRIKLYIKSSGLVTQDGKHDIEGFLAEREAEEQAEITVDQTIEAVEAVDELAHVEKTKQQYIPAYITANAITLTDQVQLVLRFQGEADAIHENFDFVHCTNYWTSWNSELVLRKDALESLLSRELRYVGSKYPVCSIIRMRKFLKRNWQINAGQILKMCMQVSQLDLSNIKVLEEQLIGVDTAYFLMLIEALKAKDTEKVDYNYMMTIIDRIF